jgi:hypothetical protein
MNTIISNNKKYINIKQDNILNDMENCDEFKECRICLDDEKDDNKLIVPCKCKGTQKYVHIKCLQTWRETPEEFNEEVTRNRNKRCGICKTIYREERPFHTENYRIILSQKYICWVYFAVSVVLSLILGTLNYNNFIIKSYTNDPVFISAFINTTKKDYMSHNTLVFSFSNNIINILYFVVYVYHVYNHVYRYRFFLYKMSPVLVTFVVMYISSQRFLFLLLGNRHLMYLFLMFSSLIYITTPIFIKTMFYSHNCTIDYLNNVHNPTTVLPYIDGYNMSDDENDNDDNNYQPPPPPPPQNNTENNDINNSNEDDADVNDNDNDNDNNNSNNHGNAGIINIEEEINIMSQFTDEELIRIIEDEYTKKITEHENNFTTRTSTYVNYQYSDGSANSDDDRKISAASDSSEYSTHSESSNYSMDSSDEESPKAMSPNIREKLWYKRIEMVSKTQQHDTTPIILNDISFIDLEEGNYTGKNELQQNEATNNWENIIKECLDKTIDAIIKESANNKKVGENHERRFDQI